MRGVAALSVVLCHLLIACYGIGSEPSFMNTLVRVLRAGVDLFFVISGFVISLAAAEIGKAESRYGTVNFTFRRLARIYPLYWIILATAVMSSYVVALQGWPDIPRTLTASYIFPDRGSELVRAASMVACLRDLFLSGGGDGAFARSEPGHRNIGCGRMCAGASRLFAVPLSRPAQLNRDFR